MGNTANWLKLAMAIVLLSATLEAQAPPGPSNRALITVRGGAQPQRPTVRATHRFDLYDETATLDSVYSIDNGPMIDLAVGRRVGRRLVLGGGMSLFRSSGPGAVTAAIPDRVFFDRPRAVTAAASELGRTELGLHAHVAWLAPVSSRLDILLSAGPSIIRLAQELTPRVAVATGTEAVTLVRERQSGTAVGVNAGLDAIFAFHPRYGAGAFFRYAGAAVDLPGARDIRAGGIQTGFGFHVRF